jgi:hypothetical protein
MPVSYEIRGTADFRRAAAKLKAAGNGKLVREMAKRMRAAARPAVEDAQRSVKSLKTSSSRGGGGQQRRAHASRKRATERAKKKAFEGRGLRDTTANALTTSVRTSARSASVQIKVRSAMLPPDQRGLPRYMNLGRWRHPVFGRGRWVTQTTNPPGWFDRSMQRHGTKIRDRAVGVVDEIIREIAS